MRFKGTLLRIRTSLEFVAGWLRFLGQLALAFMVLTICYDVIMRYAFKMPTLWSLEVNTFLVIFITLIPAADVLKSNAHLRITFFLDKMGRRAQRYLNNFTYLLGFGFGTIMTWKGFEMAMAAFKYNERMSTPLGTPLFIPYLFIPIGFGLMSLLYLLFLLTGSTILSSEKVQTEV